MNTTRTKKKSTSRPRTQRRVASAPPSDETNAIDLLLSQHEEVKTLFSDVEKARDRAKRDKLFEELASKLVGHDAIEREIFYPACEEGMGLSDLLGEALVEHGVVEFSLYQADQARDAKDFSFKCQVLSEIVEHHVKEEEEEFFPKVVKALGRAKLGELGARMQQRFAETQSQGDFRTPLQVNLRQVLAGALKPSKAGAARGRNPKALVARAGGRGKAA